MTTEIFAIRYTKKLYYKILQIYITKNFEEFTHPKKVRLRPTLNMGGSLNNYNDFNKYKREEKEEKKGNIFINIIEKERLRAAVLY